MSHHSSTWGVMLSYGNFEKATLKHRLQEGNAKLQQVRRFVHNRRTAGPRSRLHIWHSTVWATVSSGLVDVGSRRRQQRFSGPGTPKRSEQSSTVQRISRISPPLICTERMTSLILF